MEERPIFLQRDNYISIELKKLQKKAPSGVYALPSTDSLLIWHGVIFLREGIYQHGVFRFVMQLSERYPYETPTVKFLGRLYHPLIGKEGQMDLSNRFPTWTQNKDHLWHILRYMKRIFGHPVDGLDTPPKTMPPFVMNEEAYQLFYKDRETFRAKVDECVRRSIGSIIYQNPARSQIVFSEPQDEHLQVRKSLLEERVDRKSWREWGVGIVKWAMGPKTEVVDV